MIWQPEFTDKTLSRKPGAVQLYGEAGKITSGALSGSMTMIMHLP
ncbi:PapG chaperone-binding domain-containing protein [Escherichia coli]|nr:PapG chaperone-binding domain-containing protein [Escherichia coli]